LVLSINKLFRCLITTIWKQQILATIRGFKLLHHIPTHFLSTIDVWHSRLGHASSSVIAHALCSNNITCIIKHNFCDI